MKIKPTRKLLTKSLEQRRGEIEAIKDRERGFTSSPKWNKGKHYSPLFEKGYWRAMALMDRFWRNSLSSNLHKINFVLK